MKNKIVNAVVNECFKVANIIPAQKVEVGMTVINLLSGAKFTVGKIEPGTSGIWFYDEKGEINRAFLSSYKW